MKEKVEVGPFSLCSNFHHGDFEVEGSSFRECPNPKRVVEDWEKTLGRDADLSDPTRCRMFREVYVTPVFEFSESPDQAQAILDLYEGTSDIYASTVINDRFGYFLSTFFEDIKKECPNWSPPSQSSYARLVKKIGTQFKELKLMLAYLPYIEFSCFMVPDEVTHTIRPQQFVRVIYTIRKTKEVCRSRPQKFEDFCQSLLLADRLKKIHSEVCSHQTYHHYQSMRRKWRGEPTSPFPPKEFIDHALEHGEVSHDELEEECLEFIFHIKDKKREAKAAAKEKQEAKDKKK